MIRPVFGSNPAQSVHQAEKAKDGTETKLKSEQATTEPQKKSEPSILDSFYSKVKNSSDLNDTIKVPRTIFKGYLAFFASTTLGALAGYMKKGNKVKNTLNISAAILALYGTYAFVRPYLLRQQPENINKN